MPLRSSGPTDFGCIALGSRFTLLRAFGAESTRIGGLRVRRGDVARRRKRTRRAERPGRRSDKPEPSRALPRPEDFALTPNERERFKRQSDLARLLPYLDEVQQHPQSIAELCGHAIVTPGVLRRLIWNATGLRPHDLAMRCSIRDVARAVLASAEPIDDIRVRFGYRSAAVLCRAFTRIAGCCPREHRRRYLAAEDRRRVG